MALPKVNQVEYTAELPLSKIEVGYRPFTVKEQKIFLIAMEDGTAPVVSKALINVTQGCVTNEDLDVRKIPGPDLEWLFLQMRCKSVGESSTVTFKCEKCGHENKQDVNLEEATVGKGDVDWEGTTNVQINDTLGVRLSAPSFGLVEEKLMEVQQLSAEDLYDIVCLCISQVYDEEQVWDRTDFSKKELHEFVDSMSSEQFNRMIEFFDDLPRLQLIREFDCEECQHHNTLEIQGLQNFFV